MGLVLAPTPRARRAGTTYYVGSTGDSITTTNCTSATNTTCTLRGAVVQNATDGGGGTVRFTAALNGQTITLTSNTTLTLAQSVTIDGTGSSVTIDGHCMLVMGLCTVTGGGTQVFMVRAGVTATLNALTIQHGNVGGRGAGGGVFNSGTLNVTNTTFSGNAARSGAVIWTTGSTLNVTNSVFSGNIASTSGGVIFAATGAVTITNSTFSGNTATNNGGVIDNENNGTVTITNSTFSGNSAPSGDGGAIYNPTGVLTVTNSTLSGNSAIDGGGIASAGAVTITNSTIANNTAGLAGGGVFISGGTLDLENTILAGNSTTGNGAELSRSGNSTVNANYTIFETGVSFGPMGTLNGTATHNKTSMSAQLSPLANNGGPTQTHAIPVSSIAYHAGNPTTCTTAVSGGGAGGTDQRGAVRDATHCSIGAFEPGAVNTTTALTANPTSAPFGTPVTLTATVSGVFGGTPPDSTATVTFKNGTTVLGTANLVGGTATLTTTTLPPGNSVTATYTAGGGATRTPPRPPRTR